MESWAEALESGEQAVSHTGKPWAVSAEGDKVRLCFEGVIGAASWRLAYPPCCPNSRTISCLRVYFLSSDMAGVSLQSLEALGVQAGVR